MPLRLEPYDAAKHYDLIASWWRLNNNEEPLPADVLPPTGAVACVDDKPIAACSVWLCNAKAAYIAFPIAAPGLRPRIAHEAIALAIAGCIDIARLEDVKMIWAATTNRTVAALFENAGLKRTTVHTNHYLMLDPALSPDTLR